MSTSMQCICIHTPMTLFSWQFGLVHCLHDSVIGDETLANRESQNLSPHLHVLESCILVNGCPSRYLLCLFFPHYIYLRIIYLSFITFKCPPDHKQNHQWHQNHLFRNNHIDLHMGLVRLGLFVGISLEFISMWSCMRVTPWFIRQSCTLSDPISHPCSQCLIGFYIGQCILRGSR